VLSPSEFLIAGELRGTQAALYFTVHNTLTETVLFTLTVDAAALGIAEPERLTIAELVSGDAVLYELQGDLLLPRPTQTPQQMKQLGQGVTVLQAFYKMPIWA